MKYPFRLTSRTRSHCSSLIFQETPSQFMPALLTRMSRLPNSVHGRLDHLFGLCKRGDVAFHGQGFAAHLPDVFGISFGFVGVFAVGQADIGAFPGKFQGGGGPDSLGASGNQGIFSFQQHKSSFCRRLHWPVGFFVGVTFLWNEFISYIAATL